MYELILLVQSRLTPDLLKPRFRHMVEAGAHPLTGHCYVACEALYHLLGGQASDFVPHTVRHCDKVHWFLQHRHLPTVLDPTAAQFQTTPSYWTGRGRGFLTRHPSKRARTLLARLDRDPLVLRQLTAPHSVCKI